MRTKEDRDKMVARVKAAFAKHPTFAKLPAATKKGDIEEVVEDEAWGYVSALYEVAALGEIIGRRDNAIIGKRD